MGGGAQNCVSAWSDLKVWTGPGFIFVLIKATDPIFSMNFQLVIKSFLQLCLEGIVYPNIEETNIFIMTIEFQYSNYELPHHIMCSVGLRNRPGGISFKGD